MTDTIRVSRELLERAVAQLERFMGDIRSGTSDELRALLSQPAEQQDDSLDARMQAAGMLSVQEMLAGQPLDSFRRHAAVVDLDTFMQWIEMKRAEFVKLQARIELSELGEEDPLYEWSLAHSAVFSEVHINFKSVLRVAQSELNEARTSIAHLLIELDAVPKWISVEERLPELDVPVWLHHQSEGIAGGIIYMGVRSSSTDGWMWEEVRDTPVLDSTPAGWEFEAEFFEGNDPTHWMPLPEFPVSLTDEGNA